MYLVKSMVTERELCWPTFEAASFVDVVDDCTCRLWKNLVVECLDDSQEEAVAFAFLDACLDDVVAAEGEDYCWGVKPF